MSLEVSIRKAKLSDSKFLLKIHNESVKGKFINSIKVEKKF